MNSEGILMFSSFVENELEYYRNVLLLILKEIASLLIDGPYCM
jgi:hypothetical protein